MSICTDYVIAQDDSSKKEKINIEENKAQYKYLVGFQMTRPFA
jgi:hypothetical protein